MSFIISTTEAISAQAAFCHVDAGSSSLETCHYLLSEAEVWSGMFYLGSVLILSQVNNWWILMAFHPVSHVFPKDPPRHEHQFSSTIATTAHLIYLCNIFTLASQILRDIRAACNSFHPSISHARASSFTHVDAVRLRYMRYDISLNRSMCGKTNRLAAHTYSRKVGLWSVFTV